MTIAAFVVLLAIGCRSRSCCSGRRSSVSDVGERGAFASFAQQLFSGIESYGLIAIPLFMLAGEIMNRGGAHPQTHRSREHIRIRARGGLAYINVLANMMMASIWAPPRRRSRS